MNEQELLPTMPPFTNYYANPLPITISTLHQCLLTKMFSGDALLGVLKEFCKAMPPLSPPPS